MPIYDEDILEPLRIAYGDLCGFIDNNTLLGESIKRRREYQESSSQQLVIMFRRIANGEDRVIFDVGGELMIRNALFHKAAIETRTQFHETEHVRKDFSKILEKYEELGIDEILRNTFNNPPKGDLRFTSNAWTANPS